MKRHQAAGFAGAILALFLVLSGCATEVPTEIPLNQPDPTPIPPTATEEPMPTQEMAEPAEESNVSPLATPAAEMNSPLATPAPLTEDGDPPSEDEMEAMSESAFEWMADGIIAEGEYASQADFGDIRVWWNHDGEFLYLAMEGDTTGWVAVGINPQNRMQGANYMFGYVADGIARLWDAYGTAPTGANHPPDNEIGGTDDIVTFTGEEREGVTRFEVQIPLDSGDQYDQALEPGNSYPIIVAIGGADDFNAYHMRYDRGELVLAP